MEFEWSRGHRLKMATPQHKMDEFLTSITQREQFDYHSILFTDTRVCLGNHFDYWTDGCSLDLAEYPSDVRKEFVEKVKILDIASLPIKKICVCDANYETILRKGEGHATDVYEDIAEIILALQSSPTRDHAHVNGDVVPDKGQAAMRTLTDAIGSTSHHTRLDRLSTLRIATFESYVAPQKLKAACSLIAAPGSSVECVQLYPKDEGPNKYGHATLGQCFCEEMLSIQMVGSCQALQRLSFLVPQIWDDAFVTHLGELLQRIPSIKEIDIGNGRLWFTDKLLRDFKVEELGLFERLAEVLCFSNHIQVVSCVYTYPTLQEALLRMLMAGSQRHPHNIALQHLHLEIGGSDACQMVFALCGEVIKMVKFLKSFKIKYDVLDLKLVEALKFNHGLEHFEILNGYVDQHGENALFSTIMDVLRVNYQLKKFVYNWDNMYYEEALTKLFEERSSNKPWEVMKDMGLVPSTSARLFFCGYPYAGKTTLKNTIIESLSRTDETSSSTSKRQKISHNDSAHVRMSSSEEIDSQDTYNRTRGIEVDATTLNNMNLTMWDMAGHDAYHPFHDLVISNMDGGGSSCCFLLVCSLFSQGTLKLYTDVVIEIKYWLQFIASNATKSILYRLHVQLVFTNFDQIKKFGRVVKEEVDAHMKPLQELFIDTLHINEQHFYVNAHDVESVRPLVVELNATLSKLLPTIPHVFEACEELRILLNEYKKSNPTRPLVKWEEFQVLCGQVSSLVVGDEVNDEVVRKRMEIVATSLHEAGEVIFYKDLNFVIINPHWFCHDVIGQVIACKDCGVLQPEMGLLSRKSLMVFLEDSWAHESYKFDENTNRDLLNLLKKLDLCFEQVNDKILIPASLCDDKEDPSDLGARQLAWPTQKSIKEGVYVGRRVAPINTNLTMLTLGFFPRLQVSFQRIFHKNEYTLKKSMISFIYNEMEIVLEYSGYIGFHIDVFIRSQDPNPHAIYEFLTTCIMKHIFQECADPIRGCPGVVLEESIIRPSCVKELVLCKYRLKQAITVHNLKKDIKESNSLSFTHVWPHEGDNLRSDYDKAMSLLSDKEQSDVLRFFSACISAARKSLMESPYYETHVSKSFEKSDEDLEMRKEIKECNSREFVAIEHLQKQQEEFLKLVQNNFDILISLVESKFHKLSNQSDVSISDLSNKLQEALTFNVDLEKTRFPKFVWFKPLKPQTAKQGQKKFKNLLGTKYMVHLRCETLLGRRMHEVENQKGTIIKVENESSAKFKKILTYTLITLSTLISIGAHVAAPGMGALVPEIAKGFLLVLDSPALLDRGLNYITPSGSSQPETIVQANKEEAEKWLRELLVKIDFKDAFGLYKVKYKNCDQSINGKVAWICEKCKIVEESQEKIEFLSCEV